MTHSWRPVRASAPGTSFQELTRKEPSKRITQLDAIQIPAAKILLLQPLDKLFATGRLLAGTLFLRPFTTSAGNMMLPVLCEFQVSCTYTKGGKFGKNC